MRRPVYFVPTVLALLGVAGISSAATTTSASVSFRQQIAPLLAEKCLACHNPSKQKGKFQLHTFDALKTPGTSRATPIVSYRPGESRLYQLLTSSDVDERMPQKADPLPAAQIDLVRRWIEQGALYDGTNSAALISSGLALAPHPEAPRLYPRPNPVRALAFSPDGAVLAAGGYHELLLFDPQSGSLTRRVGNLDQQTYAVAFSSNGQILAAASGAPGKSGEYKMFVPQTGESLRSLALLPDVALAIDFNADGSRLAAGGADNTLRVFDTGTGREELAVEAHTDWLLDVVFSPDGSKVICASRDKTVRVLDSRTGELLTSYLEHEHPVYAVAVAADGRRVFSADAAGQLHAWDLESGKKSSETKAVTGAIYRVKLHGEKLVIAGADHTVREYRCSDKLELLQTYSGAADHVFAVALFPERHWVAAGGYEGVIRVWSTEQSENVRAFRGAPGR